MEETAYCPVRTLHRLKKPFERFGHGLDVGIIQIRHDPVYFSHCRICFFHHRHEAGGKGGEISGESPEFIGPFSKSPGYALRIDCRRLQALQQRLNLFTGRFVQYAADISCCMAQAVCRRRDLPHERDEGITERRKHVRADVTVYQVTVRKKSRCLSRNDIHTFAAHDVDAVDDHFRV